MSEPEGNDGTEGGGGQNGELGFPLDIMGGSRRGIGLGRGGVTGDTALDEWLDGRVDRQGGGLGEGYG